MERELIRRKNEEIRSRVKNHVYTKTKTKKARIGGRKEKKRYDWIAIFFEEIIH